MRNPGRLVLGVTLVVALLVALWRLRHDRGERDAASVTPKPAEKVLRGPRPDPASGVDRSPQIPLQIDDDPRGALRLEGVVLDADEHPVAGATVVLGANPPRTTTSEADGGFAFDALIGRPYTLVARAPGGIAGPITARLTANSPPVELHLKPAANVTVTVVGEDGKRIDGATVELRGIDDQRETAKAGIATFGTVVPGGYQVAAWAGGMAHAFQWLQVGPGDNAVKVTLAPGAAVAGRVVDEHGTGVAGAQVVFSGASDWSAQGSDRADAVTSGADGAFKFAAMPAGSFRFVATHPDLAPGTSSLVTLDGKSDRTGVTITLAAGAVVRGRVVDGHHQLVASARVRIGLALRTMIVAAPRQAFTDAAGSFEIKGLPRRELVAVAIHETASSQSVPVDASAGDVGDVVLTLDVTGTIAGVVVDPNGRPIEGAQVSAGPNFRDSRATVDMVNWRLRGFPQELTDASGHFTLTGLAAGSYLVNAMPARSASRGRRGTADGTPAQAGQTDLRLVLQPEGAVKGRVAFADGTTPTAFSISIGMAQQSFLGDGAFTLDALAPQTYELGVRGPGFQTRAIEVTVEPTKTADVGTIVVVKGRSVGGVVVADGQPVAGATVYAGRMIFGNGTSNSAQFGPMGRGTKEATTGSDGTFAIAGFGDGDVTIVAEHPSIGRSKGYRLPSDVPGTDLTIALQKFGALSGTLRQGGKPAEGVFVSCQSTTSPGALYSVASGPDGSYRFDKLAPDVYKVSATLGMPMTGMRFYSKQIAVPEGKEVSIDLAVEPGTITLGVTVVPHSGTLGVANVWLATGVIVSKTATDLQLQMAAAGPGASQWVILRNGEPAVFKELVAGAYSACVVPFPAEVKGMAAMSYAERHGDKLPAFCKAIQVLAAPSSQSTDVPVDLPPFVADSPPAGSAGSGAAK